MKYALMVVAGLWVLPAAQAQSLDCPPGGQYGELGSAYNLLNGKQAWELVWVYRPTRRDGYDMVPPAPGMSICNGDYIETGPDVQISVGRKGESQVLDGGTLLRADRRPEIRRGTVNFFLSDDRDHRNWGARAGVTYAKSPGGDFRIGIEPCTGTRACAPTVIVTVRPEKGEVPMVWVTVGRQPAVAVLGGQTMRLRADWRPDAGTELVEGGKEVEKLAETRRRYGRNIKRWERELRREEEFFQVEEEPAPSSQLADCMLIAEMLQPRLFIDCFAMSDIKASEFFDVSRRLMEEGNYAEAAATFQAFTLRFPDSSYVDEALFNAANNLDKSGNVPAANQLFEQYIQRFPTDQRVVLIYFRMAGNYSRILELQKAVEDYEAMVLKFPTDVDAPAALYNAALLRSLLGDHQGAARGYERYATEYPALPDVEAVFWQAGEQWAWVSDRSALDFYQRYLARYPAVDGNHEVEAWYRIGKLYEKQGDTRRAAQAHMQLQSVFMAHRGDPGFEGGHYAAEAPVAALLARAGAFGKVKFTGNQRKDLEILNVLKLEEYRSLDAAADQIANTYQDVEADAAIHYIRGLLAFLTADLVDQMPQPKGFSEQDIATYRQLLDEKVRLPFEEKGRDWLSRGISVAREKKLWSPWNSRSMELLHERFPLDYPGERPESRGQLTLGGMPLAGPEGVEIGPFLVK